MIDVGAKPVTRREAVARGSVRMSPEALRLTRSGSLPKGDALGASRLAGIMAAKRTSELLPLCHPLSVDYVEVTPRPIPGGIEVEAVVRCAARTGVEMEALTAVSIACLTLYDMAKSVDPAMTIGPIYLQEKRGGLSGDYLAPQTRVKVEVLFFASAREWAGARRLELELPEGRSLSDLLSLPALSGLSGRPARFAVNEEFAALGARLKDGDVVAVLPPVSGG